MKNDFILPILVLTCICLFVSSALAIVNNFTKDVIKENAELLSANQKEKIMGEGVEFETLDLNYLFSKGMSGRVTGVFRATNNMGYIVEVSSKGYGREDMKLLCGINIDGKIIKSTADAIVLSHTETVSFFRRVFNDSHLDNYWLKDRAGIENIDAVSGATITSNALKNAMRHAFTAFHIVTNGNQEADNE
ncbi:MAG: FMN-binding protein [Treponema sp.]|nr:FMN-binding protein [Treponema sp.]